MSINQDPIHSLIADIRNRTLSARYVLKKLRDSKINEVQAVLEMGIEFDRIDKIMSECEEGVRGKEE